MGRIRELIIHEKQQAHILMQTCMETTHGKQAINKRTLIAKLHRKSTKAFWSFFLIGYKMGTTILFWIRRPSFPSKRWFRPQTLTVIMQSFLVLGLQEILQLLAGLPSTRLWWKQLTFTGKSIQANSSHISHLISVQLLQKWKKM